MIWLVTAIFCSSSIVIIWKMADKPGIDRYIILRWNYLIASSISCLFAFQSVQSGFLRNHLSYLPWVLLLAIPVGVIFFVSFDLYAASIQKNGAIVSASIAKMGVFLPIALSMIIWHEPISIYARTGIFIGIFTLTLYAWFVAQKEKAHIQWVMVLIWLFITQGFAEFSNKVFQGYFPMEWKSIFLALVFLSAFVVASVIRRNRLAAPNRINHSFLGIMLGIFNFFSSFYLIKALTLLASPLVYISFSLGTMVLVFFVSIFWFREPFPLEKRILLFISMIVMFLLYIPFK